MSIDDVLEALPTLLAREPDAAKRQEIQKTAASFKEVKNRKLLCDFHGIRVFEYLGQPRLELDEAMQARMQDLELHTSAAVREMIGDLSAISTTVSHKIENIKSPPEPQYDQDGLVNGEAFHKAAASIWARTAMHRGLWELLRTRLGARLDRLNSATGKDRREHAAKLKKDIGAAIDAMADASNREPHGTATLVEWTFPDAGVQLVTLPWAAIKITIALIFLNLKVPSKGEVRKIIEAKWPKVRLTDAAWAKVWKANPPRFG